MFFAKVIALISIFIWIIIPLRQFNSKYFIYFLILAILDPLILIIQLFVVLEPFRIYSVAVLFQIMSLINFKKNAQFKFILFLVIIINIWLSFYLSISEILLLIIFENFIVLSLFFRLTILNIFESIKINLFYVILILYVLSIIMKFFVDYIDIKFGLNYFYLTSAFEIIVGIFFIFFNDKNSPKLNWGFNKNI